MSDMPQRLGPYEIRGKLGSGGMGIVYEGWDARLNRRVAIKTLWPELAREPEACARFMREARAVAALSHSNVTQIYDIGQEGELVYFAMEYLEGPSLHELLKKEKMLSAERACYLIKQAAAGLRAAYEQGIVHRDVKPANLVLAGGDTLKVTDFGLAKSTLVDSNLTATGEAIGTPHYISPEQASGRTMDQRSDIYSLGATFYELVTGRTPFDGPTAVSVIMKHMNEPVVPARRFNPDLPYPLVTLIQRMLAKRPEQRPRNYDEVIAQIDKVAGALSNTSVLPAVQVLAGHAGQPGAAGMSSLSLPSPVETEPGSRGWALPAVMVLLAGLAIWIVVDQMSDPGETLETVPTIRELSVPQKATPQRPTPQRPRPVRDNPRSGTMAGPSSRADLQIIENSHEFTPEGLLRIMGRVENIGNSRATGSRMRILLVSDAGQTLDTTEVSLMPSAIAPGQGAEFQAFFPDPSGAFRVKLEVTWIW